MAGKLVVIGGAEDQEKHCIILKTALGLCADDKPHVAVIASASAQPEEAGKDYEKTFSDLGAESVRILKVASREAAQDENSAAVLREADLFFLTGGDQLRLTSLLGGTSLLSGLRLRFREGAVIAGTSAGASAMSGTMIIGGNAESPPQRGRIEMSPGLGFLPGVLIDQHFAQRGRFGRLLAAAALNPDLLGLGIDEDTAVIVRDGRWLEVVGTYGVTVIDGALLIHTNVSEAAPRETLTLSPFYLHVLSHGSRFDLRRRQMVVQGEGA